MGHSNNKNKNKIIVDINVANCNIRAARPYVQIPIPNDDAGKSMFWNTCPTDRLNKRVYGTLKGRGLKKAEKIVDENGGINISGEYGSIKIDESDFISS